ncbi:MAG TPA: ABC transporter permease, partial [Pyrinomonadaceae bacterium]|nr:ABC transporter permease [Pyrinomonadaceae bacterium]
MRREYVQGVRSKTFIVSTVLGPFMMAMFVVVPGLLMGIKTGGATRLAVVDLTEGARMYEQVRESLLRAGRARDEAPGASPSAAPGAEEAGDDRIPSTGPLRVQFEVEQADARARSLQEVKNELNARVTRKQLDAYVVIPPDSLARGRAEFYGRNTGDVLTIARVEDRLSRAVVERRMREEGIDQARVRELSRPVRVETVKVSEAGEEREAGGGSFFLALGVATFILIAILMYGQAVLSAVVEEKTTRIAEVLFSSVKAFPLMAGKLVGVSLVGLTQYAVWALIFLALTLYGAGALAAAGVNFSFPNVAPSV